MKFLRQNFESDVAGVARLLLRSLNANSAAPVSSPPHQVICEPHQAGRTDGSLRVFRIR
jgi:hypothetical protein